MAYLDIYNYYGLIDKLRLRYSEKNIILKYFDDENEEVVISSQIELDNAIEIAKYTNNELKLIVKNSTDVITIDYLSVNLSHQKKSPTTLVPSKDEDILMASANTRQQNYLANTITQSVDNELINLKNNLIGSSISSISLDESTMPPVWFTNALNKFKTEILHEIDGRLNSLTNKIQLKSNDVEPEILTLLEQLNSSFKTNNLEDLKLTQNKLNALGALKASFERDCNVPDGTKFKPNTKFKKSWLLKNTGSIKWNENTIELVNMSGNIICKQRNVYLPNVDVNEIVEVEVEFETPKHPGNYYSQWMLMCQNYSFGPRIWCEIEVVVPNLLTGDDFKLDEINNFQHEFQTSTPKQNEINDELTHLLDELENDDHEFVVIPECFDLTKPWKPVKAVEHNRQSVISDETLKVSDPILTASTQVHNLMSFSTSTITAEPVDAAKNSSAYDDCKLSVVESLLKFDEPKDLFVSFAASESNNMTSNIEAVDTKYNDNQTPDSSIELIDNSDNTTSDHANYVILPTGADLTHDSSIELVDNTENTVDTNNEQMAASVDQNTQLATPSLQQAALLQQTNYLLQLLNENNIESPMDILIHMGFANRQLNKKLLDKYDNDLNKIIEFLLEKSDNDWATYRY